MIDYGLNARLRGLKVLIAGAGGAAHLPACGRGHDAAVIGVPIALAQLDGLDSLLSIAQMPGACRGHDRHQRRDQRRAAGARILSLGDNALAIALEEYRQSWRRRPAAGPRPAARLTTFLQSIEPIRSRGTRVAPSVDS